MTTIDYWQDKEFIEELSKAGFKFDGHVTHGSLLEQVKVIRNYLEKNKSKLLDEWRKD